MKKGYVIILLISLLGKSSSIHTCQDSLENTPASSRSIINITRDWWYGTKNQERKEHRESRRKQLFTANKKTIEKRKAKKAQNVEKRTVRCDEKYLKKGHYIIGDIHHKKAEKLRLTITQNKEELCNVQMCIKKIRLQEKQRLAKMPLHIRHNALLTARRAETKAAQKAADYACARMHGTAKHPKLKKLEQKASDLRFKIKMDTRELNKMRGIASAHYGKADFGHYLKKIITEQHENNIISGKSWKRTRKNLNESQEKITRKKEIEVLRKEKESARIAARKEQREARIAARRKNKSCKESAAPIKLVVQKRSH